jgi:hypothetical protein
VAKLELRPIAASRNNLMDDPNELARRAMTERRLQADEALPAEGPCLAGASLPAHSSLTPHLCFKLAIARRPLKASSAHALVLTPSRMPNADVEVWPHD